MVSKVSSEQKSSSRDAKTATASKNTSKVAQPPHFIHSDRLKLYVFQPPGQLFSEFFKPAQVPVIVHYPRQREDMERSGWIMLLQQFPSSNGASPLRAKDFSNVVEPKPASEIVARADVSAACTALARHIQRAVVMREDYHRASLTIDKLDTSYSNVSTYHDPYLYRKPIPPIDVVPVPALLGRPRLEELTIVLAALKHIDQPQAQEFFRNAGATFRAGKPTDQVANWTKLLSDDRAEQALWHTMVQDAMGLIRPSSSKMVIATRAQQFLDWDKRQATNAEERQKNLARAVGQAEEIGTLMLSAADDLLLEDTPLTRTRSIDGRQTALSLQFTSARLTSPQGLAWLRAAAELNEVWEPVLALLNTSVFASPPPSDLIFAAVDQKIEALTQCSVALTKSPMPQSEADMPKNIQPDPKYHESQGPYSSVPARLESLVGALRRAGKNRGAPAFGSVGPDATGIAEIDRPPTVISNVKQLLEKVSLLVGQAPENQWSVILRQEVLPVSFATLRQAREQAAAEPVSSPRASRVK